MSPWSLSELLELGYTGRRSQIFEDTLITCDSQVANVLLNSCMIQVSSARLLHRLSLSGLGNRLTCVVLLPVFINIRQVKMVSVRSLQANAPCYASALCRSARIRRNT